MRNSPGPYLLGIDVGTYESKGVIATPSGQVVASARQGHGLSLPRPGWAEHDAEAVWWRDLVLICRQLLATSGIAPEAIACAAVSALAPCVVPIDRGGRPLRPAILYGIDTRAAAEAEELERMLGREAMFAVGNVYPSSQEMGPRMLWLQRHEPDVWAKAETILTGSSYLVFRLTGEKTVDVYNATDYAPLFDVRGLSWAPQMAQAITPLEKLPRIAWAGEVVGALSRRAAEETGLAPGTPVVAGTADAGTEALSAGLALIGDLMVMYGSSTFFIEKTDHLLACEQLWGARYLEEGSYVVAAGMSTGGSLTRWFRDQFAPQETAAEAAGGPSAYQALAQLAAGSPPGSRGLVALPYFLGERTPIQDPEARGVFAGLTLSHTRADLYRALLESVGYGVRHNVEVMCQEGVPPRRILAVGGGTRNPTWLQIVSDIAGIEQYVPDQHLGASYGDAFLAGVGAGLFHDTTEVVDWIHYRQVVRPDPAVQAQYEDYYAVYRQLYHATAPTVHRLARLAARDAAPAGPRSPEGDIA